MLYVLGGVVSDTFPFNTDSFSRAASADFAEKGVMGSLDRMEFTGEGSDTLEFSGRLLPYKTGGLTQFEILDQMRRTGARFPVMRGDGKRLGTYVITSLSERHDHLMRDGVGFTVDFSVSCRKVSADYDGASIIMGLLSLFQAVR